MTDLDTEGVYLDNTHHMIIHKICFGCLYYKSNEDVRTICSIIGLYTHVKSGYIPFSSFLKCVEGCPCNQGCLVKVTCTQVCPKWEEYTLNSSYGEIKVQAIRWNIMKEKIKELNERDIGNSDE